MKWTSSCACGRVAFEAAGAPIISAICYCDDCQEGGLRIEALPGAPLALDPDGGSAYILFRKDRVACVRGTDLLKPLKLRDTSPTNRVVATCCNAAMLIRFDDSKHWVSMWRARFAGELPPVEMRVCTKFKPGELPNDVPVHPGFAPRFVLKLVGARIAMLFGP